MHNTRPSRPAGRWSTSPRSSPGWRACAGGSAPRWTASIPASSPAARWISCRCPPTGRQPGRRHRCEQAPHPRRPGRRARPGPVSRRVHRGRYGRQGPRHDRADPAGYTTRQAAYDLRKLRGKQLISKPGQDPPLLVCPARRPDHIGAAHPPGPRHRADPRRRPRSRRGRPRPDQADPHRPGLRDPPDRHGNPVPPPGHPARPSRGIALRETQTFGDHGTSSG